MTLTEDIIDADIALMDLHFQVVSFRPQFSDIFAVDVSLDAESNDSYRC